MKTRVFSAAEILLRIYQNPIHLDGTRWRTRFWRQREVRRRKNVVRQRFPFKCMGFCTKAYWCHILAWNDSKFRVWTRNFQFGCGNSAADISKLHTFPNGTRLADDVLEAAWSSPTEKTLNGAAKFQFEIEIWVWNRNFQLGCPNFQFAELKTSIKYYGVAISTWSHLSLQQH